MSAESFRQEMPPKGGYADITWKRVPLKSPLSGAKIFSAWLAVTVASYYVYGQCIRFRNKIRRENEEVTVALEPLLMAERDRIFLNQLRKNREEEAELMKNVPGWKVGTLYGEPLYKTVGDNIIHPLGVEYYVHSEPNAKNYMFYYDMSM
ncbi:NADH dehydrogenase [ubiquinone] 1 alpha subcomplex subunit 13-like [Stegodyphus dumicola]|uniref:NADH dehydrogenase [ubiquinone] 1 alpha subcomplex subunit 13-like n=1 Tax=Stegodyphus dumicola TaxID=202533 RepID=UPI0015AD3D8A|nr:NADH dehydrogenase [ubiquinone] 1 alpha subcomplex subunit 13-like [Stegodyphus dumicola]